MFPSSRQRTQGEIINLALAYESLGNPFSVRRIPFSILRDMLTDPMIGFAYYYTKIPLMRADWMIKCEDPQIAQAVDEALRQVNPRIQNQLCGKLGYGYQPMVKKFKLGQLSTTYRDQRKGADPDQDHPVWTSSTPALLWDDPYVLAPEHCMPRWNDQGEFDGFQYSLTPVPNPTLLGVTELYGYQDVPGYTIPAEFAVWAVNERDESFGSIFGSPRTKRAYRYWWCNPPEAPILMADYTLRPLGTIQEGDEVLGWEPQYGKRASGLYEPRLALTKTTVRAVSRRPAQKMVKVTFESGHVIRCTPQHLWNLYPGANNNNRTGTESEWGTVAVDREISRVIDLHANDKPFIYEALDEEQQIAANWLGGIYDGEGSGAYIAQSESHNPDVCDRIEESLELLGFEFTKNQESYWIQGGREEVMRLARLARPTRTHAMDRVVLGHRFRRPDKIVSVEPDGEDMAIGLTTGTGNYVAWGLASKNSYWYRWALADRIFETSADPVKLVYYPTDTTEGLDPNDPDPQNPTALSLQAKALEIGAQARQGATLAIPGDFMTDESTGRVTNVRKWAVSYLENHANFSALDSTFTQLDALKFRAMLLPEEAFVQPGQGQRSARNVATQLGELYQESTQLLAAENDEEINKHFIPQFIEANFPDRVGITCYKDSTGFGTQDQELITQIIQLVGQVKGEVLPVDMRELLRQQGIPLLTQQQQQAQEAQIAKEAQAMGPPVAPPENVGMQGNNAGVGQTPQGTRFYYSGRDRIDLSTAHEGFLYSLPKSVPAYQDPAVRAKMQQLNKLMSAQYKTQLDDFIDHLKDRTTLRLAQQTTTTQQPQQQPPPNQGLSAEGAAGVAATLVTTWLGVQAAQAIAAPIKLALYGIALRAGESALKAAAPNGPSFDEAALGDWAERRSQFVAASIDNTLKSEMQTFLTAQLQKSTDPDEVIAAAESRFDTTPVTHAERVVLAEALPAYNYGQLLAFNTAGVSQVQAHDASDGRDDLTDAACKQRDGEVMTVSQAVVEAAGEHPAGTLYFTALSTDSFTTMIVDELPGELLASYDSAKECLSIVKAVTTDQHREFMLATGSALALTW
jgi:hypothetical protein